MRDRSRKPSRHRQLLRLAQCLFAALALARVQHNDSHPAHLARRRPHRVGARQPRPRAALGCPFARSIPDSAPAPLEKNPLDRAFQLICWPRNGAEVQRRVRPRCRLRLLPSTPQTPGSPGRTGLAVAERQPDRRVRQHRIQQRECVVQPRPLFGERRHHAVECFDQIADLVLQRLRAAGSCPSLPANSSDAAASLCRTASGRVMERAIRRTSSADAAIQMTPKMTVLRRMDPAAEIPVADRFPPMQIRAKCLRCKSGSTHFQRFVPKAKTVA